MGCFASTVSQLYEWVKHTASASTVLTTIAIIFFIGCTVESKERSFASRKLRPLKKVRVPSIVKQRYSRKSSPQSLPLAPRDGGIRKISAARPIEKDYEAQIQEAIIKAKAILSTTELKQVVPDELYEFISDFHPKKQPSARFLSTIANEMQGYRDYDWSKLLSKRRDRRRYRSFNAPRTPPTIPSIYKDPENSERRPEVLYPILKLGSMELQDDAISPTTVPPSQYADSRSSSMSESYTDSKVEMRGGLNPHDLNAYERLRVKIGSADNAVVCTIGHPEQAEIQPWRLISKETLPFDKLFKESELAKDCMSDWFHTTYSAIHFLIENIEEKEYPDDEIFDTLMGFGSDLGRDHGLGALIDVEYMRPYPSLKLTQTQRDYWMALRTWKNQALHGLGVKMLETGEFVTDGEEFFDSMGWTMKFPKKKERESPTGTSHAEGASVAHSNIGA